MYGYCPEPVLLVMTGNIAVPTGIAGGIGPAVPVSVVVIVVALGATHSGALLVVLYASIEPFVIVAAKNVVALVLV